MNREEQLAKAPMNRLMLSMALPTMTAQVINILYSLVDRVCIGHIPGVESAALTGVGVTLPIILLISAFSLFVGSGGGPLASISLGRGDRERAERILGCGVWLLLAFAAVLMVFFYAFQRPLLMAFGASEQTIGYAETYLSWYLPGTVSVQLALGLNPYIIFQGQSSIAMCSVLIGAVMNLLLDPLFIFVFGMGVRGAAAATVISQTASALWVLAFLTGKNATLKLRRQYIRLDRSIAARVFALGVSPFTMQSTNSIIQVVMNRGLQIYGGDLYVGSLTIMQSLTQLYIVPVHGFTAGCQPIVSYNYGAGNFDRVRSACKRVIGFVSGFLFVMSLIVIVFPAPLARCFTSDAALVELVARKMPLFACGLTIFGAQMGIQPCFVALGQAKVSFFIAVNRKILLMTPLAIVLPWFFGADGVYAAEPVADVISAATAVWLFKSRIGRILSYERLNSL